MPHPSKLLARRPNCPDCGERLVPWGPGEFVCPSCTRFAPAGRPDPEPPNAGAVGLPIVRPNARWPGLRAAA
jgi:tRNA(Ile2) C34 agmatinyltransferase TiaS